jgi:hypothetical protein
MEELTKQFGNNFNLPTSKEKKGWKCNTPHKEKILKNGTLNCLERWQNKGCNIFKQKIQGQDASRDREGHPRVKRQMNDVLNVSIFNFIIIRRNWKQSTQLVLFVI